MRAPPPVIRYSEVSQVFGSGSTAVTALDRLSFDINRHEFVAVLGPSGCGKSTLMRLVAGLVKPTSGRVEIYGDPIVGPRDEIGIVFQRPVLLPWLDVVSNVTFPMRHKHGHVSTAEHTRALELLRLVGLTDFVSSHVNALSGGMQQRVAMARALLLDPEILLMDEPFSALDALTRDEMSFEIMRILEQRPKTVLFITHSIPEAVLLSHRIIVMAPRPGSVREIIDVPLPRPRTLETLSDPVFHALANRIRSQLFTRQPG